MAAAAGRFAARVVGPRGAEFVTMAGATIRNVSRGVIGVAVLQALAGGIVMAAAGVPAAGALAFAALLLAIVQIGPGPVFVGAIIWAWAALSPLGAIVFTVVMVPIMLSDNVLKPMLMARGLSVPMLVILVGVLGGTLSYGLIGLFLGPIVLSVFWELLAAWVAAPPPAAVETAAPRSVAAEPPA
jgi:predicted PurR-regulated permease PerM